MITGSPERLAVMADGHCKDLYYRVRDREIDRAEEDAEVAAWFIYLNRTGFNGLYRVNRSGRFNVPLGRYANPNICDEGNLTLVSQVLQNAEIRHEGFEAVFDRAESGDLVYFDPPMSLDRQHRASHRTRPKVSTCQNMNAFGILHER